MIRLNPLKYMLVIKIAGDITFEPRGDRKRAPPGAIRALTAHQWKAIQFSGEQEIVIRCYQNGNPLGDRCVQALLDIYQGLNYPVKHYTIQPGGIYWRDEPGTPVPQPARPKGQAKPLMTINHKAREQRQKYMRSDSDKEHGKLLTDEQREFIKRHTGPLYAKQEKDLTDKERKFIQRCKSRIEK